MGNLVPEPPEGVGPHIGDALWRLQDARERTLLVLAGVPGDWIDRAAERHGNTVGTLLYHVAAIELDWIFSDLVAADFPAGFREWFAADVRDAAGRLSAVTGETKQRHLDRLAWVRDRVMDALRALGDEEFVTNRHVDGRDISPVWIVHHLTQHEAEHRGQIQALMTMFGAPEPT